MGKDIISKNYAFIDSQNLNLGIKNQGWKLDFKRFRVFLRDKYLVSKTFLFIGYIPVNRKMYSQLQKDGYTIIFKPVLETKLKDKTVKIKGNVDAELVLHAMIEYNNYDKAVVVSGDGDFHCLIEYLLKKRKLRCVIVPNFYKFSALLRKFMTHLVFLDRLKIKLEYKNERH